MSGKQALVHPDTRERLINIFGLVGAMKALWA